MLSLSVVHSTIYRYRRPVKIGQHRAMLRPRDSHDLRLVDASLTLSPPGNVRWMHDVFGNSVALIDFDSPAQELKIESTLHLARYGMQRLNFPIDPSAENYPFIYSTSDRGDLGRLLEEQYPDPQNTVENWAKGFVEGEPMPTGELLKKLNGIFRQQFKYAAREEEGTQTPLETLERKTGTCRDFALLFIEAARALGFGARFVSGYLYDPALDRKDADENVQGAGATHAWADVYLPGAGWVEYDPTNNAVAAENLVRVATTRDASQAVPIAGSFDGAAEDFAGLEVVVTVTAKRSAAI